MKPLLRFSPLSGRVYLLTRYRVKGNAVVASKKYDVTDEYRALPHRQIAKRRDVAQLGPSASGGGG